MRVFSVVVFYALLSASIFAPSADAAPLQRDADPVVLSGQDLGSLIGTETGRIVGFRYENGWVQIPIQIDQRKEVDFGTVYNTQMTGLTTIAYADPETFCGDDPDPDFDSDDELVFMTTDVGPDVDASGYPNNVLPGSGLQVYLVDPLDGGEGNIYLFVSDGTGALSPDAGQDYVKYEFHLLAGNYQQNYNLGDGYNPEKSLVATGAYSTFFTDRWIREEIRVQAEGANDVDILDRQKIMFAPGNCERTETTFSKGEGAFFANIDGPVRAIRSYLGANSGIYTQRDHRFYRRREDVTTTLRVHPIPGNTDLFDYSPAATGMRYFNDFNATGFGAVIDGYPDSVFQGPIQWELVTGSSQGSLVMVHRVSTDIPGFNYTAYYSDNSWNPPTQCTGDAYEYGTSGPQITQEIPNTDPQLSDPVYHLRSDRVIYYEGPDKTVADAETRHGQATTPLEIKIRPF